LSYQEETQRPKQIPPARALPSKLQNRSQDLDDVVLYKSKPFNPSHLIGEILVKEIVLRLCNLLEQKKTHRLNDGKFNALYLYM